MDQEKIEELHDLYIAATDTPVALPGAMTRFAEAQELFMSEVVESWPQIYIALKTGARSPTE